MLQFSLYAEVRYMTWQPGGHQGRTRTFNKFASAYYWQGSFTDVTKWVRYLKTQAPGPQDGFKQPIKCK